jgi:hypothetical protein
LQQADGKTYLTAGWAWERLAECDQLGEGLLVKPAQSNDKLTTKVTDMGDGTAKRGAAQPKKT